MTEGNKTRATAMPLEAGLREMIESERLTESMIPDDFIWLNAMLGEAEDDSVSAESSGHSYTIILLYPDSVSHSDVETYCVDITDADHPRDAVVKAQHQCLADNGWPSVEENPDEGYDPVDFVPLYIFNGIAPDMTFGHFGQSYQMEDVPDRACGNCGKGIYTDEQERMCCKKAHAEKKVA